MVQESGLVGAAEVAEYEDRLGRLRELMKQFGVDGVVANDAKQAAATAKAIPFFITIVALLRFRYLLPV